MKLITDTRVLTHEIEVMLHSAKSQRKQAHLLLCSALNHAKEHGDWRPLNRLIEGTKALKHLRTNAMLAWVAKHSPLRFNPKAAKPWSASADTEWDIVGAMRDPFYSSDAGKGMGEGKDWDSNNYMQTVLKVLKRHEVDPKEFAALLLKTA